MVFSSSVFLFLFLPAVLIFYYNPVIKSRAFRNIFLLLASLGFYAWGEPVFVFLMIASILITWLFGICIQKTGSKGLLVIGILYHAAILFVFKYLTFAVHELGKLTSLSLPTIQISLPIGISFFTFQLMSYLFDIYYKDATAQKNPLYVGLYTALFPQLIAGPIVRYKEIAEQIHTRKESLSGVSAGMHRFIYGMGKKLLLANYMAAISDPIFSSQESRSVLTAWLGAAAYTLQIYFDFSGYSDMAIGLGRMFGFDFRENFRYPYISRSVTEFWRRWHISLSSWFRDYVYIPLGGSRVKKSKWIFNLFCVWLLTGIWHGANWTFILWGMIYFVLLLTEKLTKFPEKISIFSHLYTMIAVMLAWVLFRSDTIFTAFTYIGHMAGIGAKGFFDSSFFEWIKNCFLIFLCAIVGTTPAFGKFLSLLKKRGRGWLEELWLFAVFVLCITVVVSSTYNPFIYFNF